MEEYCCKVDLNNSKYSLEEEVLGGSLNEYLVAKWEGRDGYPETGIRPLTEWFNKKILQAVYAEHDRRAIEIQIDADYEALTSDDEIRRGSIVEDLKEDGIDHEQLSEDFVSTTTIYRHLSDHLDAEKPQKERSESDWEQTKIEYARETMRKNVEDALQSLENKDRLPDATKAEISTPVILGCPECSMQVRFERALKQGYICDTHRGEEAADSSTHSSPDASPGR